MSLLSDLNDKIKRLSARVAAEFKTQQLAIDSKVATVNGIAPDENGNVEIAAGNAALPLGWEYTRLVSDSAPKGGVDYLGQEATREFYADLWEWVNIEHPGRIISEADWQAMYAAQNGNVPYYSTGDGSTTFRFPRTVSYLRVGDTAGQYTAEGLPDHDHTRGTMNITGKLRMVNEYNFDNESVHNQITGAFSTTTPSPNGATINQNTTPSGDGVWAVTFDASKTWTGSTSLASESDGIYGASDHVTPETITVVMGVIAFGEVRSIGTATEEGIVADLGYLEDSVDAIRQDYVKKAGDTMTGVLSSDVDGFISVVRAEGDTYAVEAKRTDSGHHIRFGIGQGGVNRGIFDIATEQWLVYYDANGYFSTKSSRLQFGNSTALWIA